MITFNNIEFLWLLFLLIPLFYFLKSQKSDLESIFSKEVLKKIKLKNSSLSKRLRDILLIVAMAFTIIALARPQIDNGEIEVKSNFINIVTAIDMSKSMFANDIYPNRFEFAKKKFIDSLKFFKKSKISLIGFSSQTFLISPLTKDFHSLEFLTKNLKLEYLNLKGTNIMALLESANNLFIDSKKRTLLIFTDGSDKKDFSKEISYAKEHNIVLYIYAIGTDKGGVIKEKNGVLKDKNGDIVIVKRNDNIKKLAIDTGGAYMRYSLANSDIKLLADTIQNGYQNQKEENSTIRDREEIFYYPLSLAILLFFISLFSIPKSKKREEIR